MLSTTLDGERSHVANPIYFEHKALTMMMMCNENEREIELL